MSKKSTQKEVIKRFISKHGNRYDYSMVDYKGNRIKVEIKCNEHGLFEQTPESHLRGSGCPKCSLVTQGKTRRINLIEKKFKNIIQPEDYKIIPLTKGKFAKVDNDDFEKLKEYNWSITVFKYCENHKLGRMHRFIMNCPEHMEIDHINHDTLDNRKSNLRICTGAQNTSNRRKYFKSKSIYKGVIWNKRAKKWQSSLCFNNKHYYLGLFDSEIEAAKTYNEHAKKIQGQFALLNDFKTLYH